MRRRYSGARTGGTGPTSATSVAPGVAPPLGPRVNSQTLPEISAASPVGPAAAWAAARVAKVSILQKSGPGCSSLSFFSTTGLTESGGGCCAADGAGDKAATPQRNSASMAFIPVLLPMTQAGEAGTGAVVPLYAGLRLPSIFPQDAPC